MALRGFRDIHRGKDPIQSREGECVLSILIYLLGSLATLGQLASCLRASSLYGSRENRRLRAGEQHCGNPWSVTA